MRRAAGEAGFTLIEAILSLVVLGIALVPLINLFANAAERHTLPDEVIASGFAAAKMEELIANRALQGWSFTAAPPAYADVDTINFPNYQWKVEVVDVAQSNFNLAQPGSNYKRVTVFVKKPDTTELKLVTLVTNY